MMNCVKNSLIAAALLFSSLHLGIACAVQSNGEEISAQVVPDVVSTDTDSSSNPHQAVASIQPVKVDILLVIDDNSSMCQERVQLAKGFRTFADGLGILFDLDVRIAVTTSDAAEERGKFAYKPGQALPYMCVEARDVACTITDVPPGDVCAQTLGPGWGCIASESITADSVTNYNGSVNTRCEFHCKNDSECVAQFCPGPDDSGETSDTVATDCSSTCYPSPTALPGSGGCLHEVDVASCPAGPLSFLTNENLNLFECLISHSQSDLIGGTIDEGLKAAWLALSADGPNATQASQFLRDDAYLYLIFISDSDDSSIDPDFCSSAWQCENDADCGGVATCTLDAGLSDILGQPTSTCCGMIENKHFFTAGLYGEYQGPEHHACAYDLECSDCETVADCNEGWACRAVASLAFPETQVHKCRPARFALEAYDSYQTQEGAPLYSLAPVAGYVEKLRSLKSDPSKILIAVVAGDALVKPSDAESLISPACLANKDLPLCRAYAASKSTADPACLADPSSAGCADFYTAKQACVRECFIASQGNLELPSGKYSTVCNSNWGGAVLGSRYLRLVEMFGDQATFANACAPESLSHVFQTITDQLFRRAARFCLPLTPGPDQTLVITQIVAPASDAPADPVSTVLVQGPLGTGDYNIEAAPTECCEPDSSGQCTGSQQAVVLHHGPTPSTTFAVSVE